MSETGFGMVPRYLRGTLTANEIAVYVALSWRADQDGHSYASQATIAQEAGMSRATVQRALKGLERKDLVLVTPWEREGDGGQTSNVYTLRVFGSDPPTMGTPPARPGRVSTKRKRSDQGGHVSPLPTMGTPPAHSDAGVPTPQNGRVGDSETRSDQEERSAPLPIVMQGGAHQPDAGGASERGTNDSQKKNTQKTSLPTGGREPLRWYPDREYLREAARRHPWLDTINTRQITEQYLDGMDAKGWKYSGDSWLHHLEWEEGQRRRRNKGKTHSPTGVPL